MATIYIYTMMVTLFLHVLPLWSYTYGFLKLRPKEASETKILWTRVAVKLEMCPTYGVSNQTCNQEFAAVKAKFGPPFSEEILGSYIVVQPRDACGKVQATEIQDYLSSYSVFALISEGNCSFDRKVANAEKAGFNAAIIYAFKKDTALTAMKSSIPALPVTIPAFYVSHQTGTSLIDTSVTSNLTGSTLLSISTLMPSASKGVRIHQEKKTDQGGVVGTNGDDLPDGGDLDGDNNFGERYFHICIYIWACVVVSSLIALSIKWGCCSRSLTRWEVKKIPLKRFYKSEGFEYQDKCPICHEEFHEGYLVRQLPCNHCYHSYCVDRWLVKMSNRCPLCKQRVSVSLLCSWNKQRDRDNLSQSAAEAEAQASAAELPPLPPIQSLTPKSLYGETIMSGPSKFIILRPGRPTRIIEAPRKDDKAVRMSSVCVNSDTQTVPVTQEESDSEEHQPQTSCNDITLQLETSQHVSSPSPSVEHIRLECLDSQAEPLMTAGSLRKESTLSLHDEQYEDSSVVFASSSSSLHRYSDNEKCKCEEIHKIWLNKPDDVVSPLLTCEGNENEISCAKCANKFACDDGAGDDHPSQARLCASSSSVDVEGGTLF